MLCLFFLMPKRPTTAADLPEHKMIDEEESELEFEDPFEDEIEHEEIVDNDNDDPDAEEEEEELRAFRPGVDTLGEDEELVPAEGAYKFLHKLELDWPCLSFDFLDTANDVECKFPMSVAVVAGTQADRNVGNDKLYVTRWSNLNKNMKDAETSDASDSDASSEADDTAELKWRQIPMSGGTSNRVRAMPQMKSIVAVFSEDAKVRVVNVQKALDEVNASSSDRGGVLNIEPLSVYGGHEAEGWGMAWNPASVGQMVTGDDAGRVKIWLPAPGGTWEVVDSISTDAGGVMDVAWKEGNVFATAHGGGAVTVWDVRTKKATGGLPWSGVDVNAVAWNPKVPDLVLTGSDDGSFKIYDARNFGVHLAHFHWHKEQITSVCWHPTDETTLLVASGDDSVSFWDMSVEADEEDESEYPAQLLFLHQGQQWIKEAKFSNKYVDGVVSTAADGFNFFRTCNI
jgi:ribosome assembly protein RRB1